LGFAAEDSWHFSAAYVTTAFSALGTLSKMFNTYRSGGGTAERTN
jgi:hypothetical protein